MLLVIKDKTLFARFCIYM